MLTQNGKGFTDSIIKSGTIRAINSVCLNRGRIDSEPSPLTQSSDRGEPHGQTCLDLNINLDSNLLLKAAYFI